MNASTGTVSPELRAELPALYRAWRAQRNRKKKPKKIRRARERWLAALAAVVERQRPLIERERVRRAAVLAALSELSKRIAIAGRLAP